MKTFLARILSTYFKKNASHKILWNYIFLKEAATPFAAAVHWYNGRLKLILTYIWKALVDFPSENWAKLILFYFLFAPYLSIAYLIASLSTVWSWIFFIQF